MKHSKSSLFLMELIIALLFFSLASTVCIRLFVNAHSLSNQTVDTNYAVNYAQNMAEAFMGCDGDLQALQTVINNALLSEDGCTLSLEQNGYYTTIVCNSLPKPGATIAADIHVYKPDLSGDIFEGESLYTVHVDLHVPNVK
ncbi:MAG: hypothetical protein K2O34_00930 [Acetatifactor sp.]|nr:hypothetical protein [Acetatifactor sp.]